MSTTTEPSGRPGALRRRLARSLLGLTLASAAVLGLAYWSIERYVEQQSLSALLSDELNHRLAEHALSAPGAPGDMVRYFRRGDTVSLPPRLQQLTPGAYDDVGLDGRNYRVLVRDVDGGDRVYLLNDVGPLDLRERQLLFLLVLGVGIIGAMAWFVSGRLATVALAPLERLGRAIQSLDPARRDARLELEQDEELRGIGIAFNQHLAALDRMTERELAFAASVSHELRTHLAVVENTAELIGLRTPTAGTELRRIERAARRARDDLDALLAMTRPHPLAVNELALEPLLRGVAAEIAAGTAAMPPIEWIIDSAATQTSNDKTVAIIFSNLLRNAVAATGAAGHIRIRIDADGFSVSDDGPGLPAGDWSRLFEPWFEGRNGGSGLGLFIAHTLATRLRGRLSLMPAQPRGLTATLSFAQD